MSHLNIGNRPAHSLQVGRVVAVIVRVLPSNTAPVLGLQHHPCFSSSIIADHCSEL